VAAGEAAVDWSLFGIGRVVSAVVHEVKEYGIICDLQDDDNLVGLIPLHQVPPPSEAPSPDNWHLQDNGSLVQAPVSGNPPPTSQIRVLRELDSLVGLVFLFR